MSSALYPQDAFEAKIRVLMLGMSLSCALIKEQRAVGESVMDFVTAVTLVRWAVMTI